MRSRIPVALLAALALAGCGSSGDDESVPQVEMKPETLDPLPELPRGFEAYISPVAGFALGRPPGWEASEEGTATLMLAPDELVSMTVSADRTNEALAADPERLAVDTFTSLPGYEGEPEPSDPRRFDHRYDGTLVSGSAIAAKSGVRQNVRVIVLERGGVVVLTAVIATNEQEARPAAVEQALDAVRTLRSRPL